MTIFKENIDGYQILTPDGFVDFAGITQLNRQPLLKLCFENDIFIKCTSDHNIFINNSDKIPAKDIKLGDFIQTSNGKKKLLSINNEEPELVYDLIEVDKGNKFYANNILVSNCEFIIADETLIDSQALLIMQPTEVFKKTGEVRWYNMPTAGKHYVISLDPSLGTGGDNAAIQVFEIPSMKQVAEWQHNKTSVQQQIKILKDITNTIGETIGYSGLETETPQIWYSVENNTLGEAALVVIDEIGEENFRGIFISEAKTHGNSRRFRKGFNTTNKSKLLACSRLKNLIETDKITVCSSNLISELKTYIAKGASYAAKGGEKDDLVAALLLIIRIIYEIKNYSPALYNQLKDEESVRKARPMPFIII